tara:strand:- start:726 stop:1424 length:699 start_codon:yes stop_codon:yes gene_type:complete
MSIQMMLMGAAGGGPLGDDSGSPYTSWTELNAAGFTSVDKWLQLGGYTYKIRIDDQGYAKFLLNNNTYTRIYWGNSINTMCGSANSICNDLNSYTVGTSPAPLWHANSSPYNDFVDWAWADAAGTTINHAFFNAFAGQITSGYRADQMWHGANDVESGTCWHLKYSDGSVTSHDRQANHGNGNHTILADNFSSTFMNSWLNQNKVLTSFKNSMADDPAGSIHTWKLSGMCIK